MSRPSSSRTPPDRGIEGGMADLRLSPRVSPPASTTGQSLIRKADMAYNHVIFETRPGECKVNRRKIDVLANYFRLSTPATLQAHCYRIELRTQGRGGYEEVLKREKAEPLFWSCYQQHPNVFPRSLRRMCYDGVGTIYSLDRLNVRDGSMVLDFFVNPPAPQQQARAGRTGLRPPRASPRAQARIIALPFFEVNDFFTNDESIRTQMVQLLDLIITQEMRCPLVQNASRFVIQGNSIFKVPTTDLEKRLCVRPIGMGEEVWSGLHMAVKADSVDQLFVNANTSSSIFYTTNLNLVDFYSQVLHGYKIPADFDGDGYTIEAHKVKMLCDILTGTKVRFQKPNGDWGVKKFDGKYSSITRDSAENLKFLFKTSDNDRGQTITVAEYFCRYRQPQIRLRFPKFPCLEFKNKNTGTLIHIPMELCATGEEPRKFKGKLSDQQLNAFIKASGMSPREKRGVIETLTSASGSYLGRGDLMNEWGVELEREMVTIKDTTILPYPNIQWKDAVSQVHDISAEYSIADHEQPRNLIEKGKKPVALVVVYVNGETFNPQGLTLDELHRREYRENTQFFITSLRAYGLEVTGPAWIFKNLYVDGGDVFVDSVKGLVQHYVKEISSAGKFVPLFMFVFPRRHERLYACIKYTCDVEFGVLSQCILRRTFKKFTGNAVTNESAKNVLLKVLAKAGGVACRVDGMQFKNVGKMTSESEATLVLAIDVSHPSREERERALKEAGYTPETTRFANQRRGQHEQLPTSRPQAANLFATFARNKCPLSVMSVVGNTDLNQTKWGVTSRVQRLGQEETVNLTEPFRSRITEFIQKTGKFPKHIVIYRDGVSDSQFKKALYEETQALETALETIPNLEPERKPTITYIVAKKRHHSRFFASNPADAPDLAGNPGANTPPGLLVEKVVTSRNSFDFFLQSHFGTLGTAAPTHYTVLRDDWRPSTSFWQTVIFAHCFGNARCTKPLSIPVPLHYAHHAAKRAKTHFDYFRACAAPPEYATSEEELVLQNIEDRAITVNEKLSDLDSLYFA